MKLRVVMADDEALARRVLREYLAAAPISKSPRNARMASTP
jgi:hypothetical protein